MMLACSFVADDTSASVSSVSKSTVGVEARAVQDGVVRAEKARNRFLEAFVQVLRPQIKRTDDIPSVFVQRLRAASITPGSTTIQVVLAQKLMTAPARLYLRACGPRI